MAKQSHKGARPRLRVDGRLARARGGTDAPRRPMLPEPLARFVRFAGTSFVCTVFDQVLAGFLFVVLRRPLAGRGFLRIQKSYLVNMAHIKKLSSVQVLLSNGVSLPVSSRGYADCKRQYLLWKGRDGWTF